MSKLRLKLQLRNILLLILAVTLSPIILPLMVLRKRRIPKEVPRILIVQTANIGDLMCTIPMVREIKLVMPGAHVAVCIGRKMHETLVGNPYVDSTVLVEGRHPISVSLLLLLLRRLLSEKYDYCFIAGDEHEWIAISFLAAIPVRVGFDLPVKPVLFRALAWSLSCRTPVKLSDNMSLARLKMLRILNIETDRAFPEMFFSADDSRVVGGLITTQGLRARSSIVVAITPFTTNSLRDWPGDHWTRLASELINRLGAEVIFIGSAAQSVSIGLLKERVGERSHNFAGQVTLNQLACLFSLIDLHICTDTGTLFIGAAVGIPTVVIAGPHPAENLSHLTSAIILKNQLPCYPCSYPLRTIVQCNSPFEKFACKERTTVEEVIEKSAMMIDRHPIRRGVK